MIRIATFATRIKEYRTMNDLTLAEMEAKTGLPAQTISRYELGQRVPKIDTSIEIADALNINPLWLQGYDANIELPTHVSEDGLDRETKEVVNAYINADTYVRFGVRKLLGLDTQSAEFQIAARKSENPHPSTGPDTDVEI